MTWRDRLSWWAWFVADLFLIVWTSVIAGVWFGAYAFAEDVRFAWRR